MVERDVVSGDLRLFGELDFAVVPVVRAELAVRLDAHGPRRVDLSTLSRLSSSGVALLEELLEDGVVLRCADGAPAHATLAACGLLDRVELFTTG